MRPTWHSSACTTHGNFPGGNVVGIAVAIEAMYSPDLKDSAGTLLRPVDFGLDADGNVVTIDVDLSCVEFPIRVCRRDGGQASRNRKGRCQSQEQRGKSGKGKGSRV